MGARFSAPVQTSPEAHRAYCKMGTGSPSQGQNSWGMALTTHPHPEPRLKKEQSYAYTPPLDLHDLFQGELYL